MQSTMGKGFFSLLIVPSKSNLLKSKNKKEKRKNAFPKVEMEP